MSKVVELFKLGLHEVPHLMYAGFLFTTGTIIGAIQFNRDRKYDFKRTKWKKRYIVYREGDPRAEKQIYPPTHRLPFF